ncbi:MAG: hypothetical protein HHAS10_10240 [Candidatus Altimarinota bacterium]
MHSQSITKYFTYSFKTLFSKQFSNIAGSSLVVHTMMMLIIYFLSVYLLYRGAEMIISLDGGEIIRFFIQGYVILFVMMIAVLISRGWQATIMPIRAIDHTKGIHFLGDIRLFHEHFGKFISFFFWYGAILFFAWNIYIFSTIILWAIHPNFGFLSLVGGLIIIIRITIRYTLSWYHMLSEGSGSLEIFLESRKFVHKRIVEVFLKILGFSIIVWIMSFFIEIFLLGFLSSPDWSSELAKITKLIVDSNGDMVNRMKSLILILEESYGKITLSGIVLCGIYSLSSVVTRAMFHIFSVHYYLHLRDEWEEGKK